MIPISVCIIMRDEEKHIETCLKHLKQYPFEIVVMDTGSQDRSIEIAKAYTDNVFSYEWNKDFSAARNACIEKASYDHVISLDADEYLDDIDPDQVFRTMEAHESEIGLLCCRSVDLRDNTVEIWLSRAFDRRRFHFEGRIHEQIVPRMQSESVGTYRLPVSFLHVGYRIDEASMRKKQARNLELLLENNDRSQYMQFQIGKSYEAMGEYEKAREFYDAAMEHGIIGNDEVCQYLIIAYGYLMEKLGFLNEVIDFLHSIEQEFSFLADYYFLMGFLYASAGNYLEASLSYVQATTRKECHTKGANGYLAFYNLGVIYMKLGMYEHAASFFQNCGDYESAKDRLHDLQPLLQES